MNRTSAAALSQARTMTSFSDVVGNRNNHFNLIRASAALAVMFVHYFWLTKSEVTLDRFLIPHHGLTSGSIAVDILFSVSGFLITASLFNRHGVVDFLSARCLRVFPGLWTMLVMVVFGLGAALTTLPLSDYLTAPLTWFYFWRWGTIVNGYAFFLPGLFEHNPLDAQVNGSLWTITIEWRLYMLFAAGWFVLSPLPTWRRRAFRVVIPLVALALYVQNAILHAGDLGAQHCFCFFAGSTIFLHGDRLPVGLLPLALTFVILALVLALGGPFLAVYLALGSYLVLNLAYAPGRRLLAFNRLGDYSYGLYIYAYPITQAIIALKPSIGPVALGLIATPSTLVLAILSWRFVEKPALAKKGAAARWAERMIDAARARLPIPAFAGGSSPAPARSWQRPDAPAPHEAEQPGQAS